MKKNEDIKTYSYTTLLQFTSKPKVKYLLLTVMIFLISIFHVFLGNQIRLGVDIALGDKEGSIIQALILLFCFVIIYALLIRIRRPFWEKLSVDNGKRLLIMIYDKIYRIPQADWDKLQKGNLFTLLESDVKIMREHLPKHLLPLIIQICSIGFGFYIIFTYSPLLCLISLLGTIPLVLLIWFYSKKIEKNSKELQKNTGTLNNFFDEEFHNTDITRVFKAEDYTNELYNRHYEKRKETAIKNKDFTGKLNGFSIFFANFPCALIIMFSVMQINNGLMTFGEMSAILTILSNVILWPMTRLPQSFANVAQQKASFNRCLDFLNLKEEEQTVNIDHILGKALSLSVKNTDYAYGTHKVLHNINLNCQIGEILLIKGPSGSGKTTLLKLLLGLYKPDNGEILIETKGGAQTCDFKSVAYVPQGDFVVEGLTLAENITMNSPSGNLELASQLSGITDFSGELPEKFLTKINALRGFSKGQLQRIAIGRAIYKNAPFIILDEPFSALDDKNAINIKENLKKLSEHKGIIIISHKDIGDHFADRTLTLERGRIL